MKEATREAITQYDKKIAAGKHGFLMHHRYADYSILSIELSIPINDAIRSSSKFLTASILHRIREHEGHIVESYSVHITERQCGCIGWLRRRPRIPLYIYNMYLLVQVPARDIIGSKSSTVVPSICATSAVPKVVDPQTT